MYCCTPCSRQVALDNLNRTSVVFAASATSTAGVLVFALLPIFVGQIAGKYQLSESDAGLSASAYFAIYALVSLSAPLWIRRWSWRVVAISGYLTMLIGLGLLYFSETHDNVLIALAITGAGAATLLPISLTLVSDMLDTERIYAITIFASQLIPALLLFGLSEGVLGAYGLDTTITASVVLTLICLALSYALPTGQTSTKASATTQGSATLGLLSLLGLSLSFAGFASMWAFFEIIASQAGLPADFSSFWIAVGLLMTAVGSIVAAWLSDRWGRIPPMLVATAIALLGSSLFTFGITTTSYAIALVIFPLAYYVALIYILAIIADADPRGTYSSLMSFALALGAISGPAIYGYVREVAGPDTLVIVVLLLTGTVLSSWVQHVLSRGKLAQ